MLPKKVQNLIIGAGPAGLAVAGRMRQQKIPFELIEQSGKIAYRWHHHYDRLHLHTVKSLSHLPHLPFPKSYPTYVPRLKLIEYYEQYAQHFDIQPIYNTRVETIEKKDSTWHVTTNTQQSFEADQVVIASGANRVPNVPNWEGQEDYKGTFIHSRAYKNPAEYKGQKVLVIGLGNTGAEIALDLSEQGINTYIAVRSPVSIVPRDVNGRPVQTTARIMAKAPFGIGDWLGTQISKLYIGNLSKYGVPMEKLPPAVVLRDTGKTPVIDIGTAKQIKKGAIKVIGDITSFYEKGVLSKAGEQLEFDAVILATGYRAQLGDFVEKVDMLLDPYGLPKAPIGTGYHKGLYFIGFDNYKLGGLLGTILTDSEVIVDDLVGMQ